jgi:hypothetical protein
MFTRALNYYQTLLQERPLTPSEQRNYADIQKSATSEIALERLLANNKTRLSTYVLTNSNLLGQSDYDDMFAIAAATKRGEIDFRQCEAEQRSGAVFCAGGCVRQCTAGDTACFQACVTRCGAPTCARTFVCMNPTWLPY